MKFHQGARVTPPADGERKSYKQKDKEMQRIVASNESVFRRASKSWRRHYKKAHGLIHG